MVWVVHGPGKNSICYASVGNHSVSSRWNILDDRVPMRENGGGAELAHFNLPLLAGAVLAWNAFSLR